MRADAARGFSLLEAIVALAIVATAGLALFAGMSQAVQMATKAEQAKQADSAMRNALAWMEVVNPGLTPSGEKRLGELSIEWTSKPVEPPRDVTTGYLSAGLYRVGLYDVSLKIHTDAGIRSAITLRKVGYVQVREPAIL